MPAKANTKLHTVENEAKAQVSPFDAEHPQDAVEIVASVLAFLQQTKTVDYPVELLHASSGEHFILAACVATLRTARERMAHAN